MLAAHDILQEAIFTIAQLDDSGGVSWLGEYVWETFTVAGQLSSVFITGSMSNKVAPTVTFDALNLIDKSRIFYPPFPSNK